MAGVGHYVPERVMTNADFEKILDTTDEWIVSRTGMHERHIARDDESTSDMGLAAAKVAIARAGCAPADIGCVIVATVTPDYLFPATASVLAAKLGIKGTAAFDMEIACSGFIYGLTVASALIQARVYQRILLVGSEKLSSITNYEDRGTAVLFGDGAGAVVLEAAERNDFLASDLGTDGSDPSLLLVPGGGTVMPLTAAGIAEKQHKMVMKGREVFRFAVTKMIEATDAALAKAGLTRKDIAYAIPHQANRRIIDAAAKQLEMIGDKVVITVDKYGNTSSASIPIALSETYAAGKLKDGDLIVFVGFGGGLSWGAVVWRWSER
ncbi:MAG: beta-ketoacyl-ACP synthase III [Candidatus Lustribacter sp.]|jgi:3-oxoacyl-[acyl-carrier-protein] synthase-3